MSENWKDEIKKEKEKTAPFKGLNDGWSTFGLKSKNAEPPKPKPYPCPDCSSSFLLKRNLQSHRKNTHRFLYEKTAPKKIKK